MPISISIQLKDGGYCISVTELNTIKALKDGALQDLQSMIETGKSAIGLVQVEQDSLIWEKGKACLDELRNFVDLGKLSVQVTGDIQSKLVEQKGTSAVIELTTEASELLQELQKKVDTGKTFIDYVAAHQENLITKQGDKCIRQLQHVADLSSKDMVTRQTALNKQVSDAVAAGKSNFKKKTDLSLSKFEKGSFINLYRINYDLIQFNFDNLFLCSLNKISTHSNTVGS